MTPAICMAPRGAITQRVISITARQMCVAVRSDVCADSDFFDDLAADSMDMIAIAIAVEDEFGCGITDDMMAGVTSVDTLVDAIIAAMAMQP